MGAIEPPVADLSQFVDLAEREAIGLIPLREAVGEERIFPVGEVGVLPGEGMEQILDFGAVHEASIA